MEANDIAELCTFIDRNYFFFENKGMWDSFINEIQNGYTSFYDVRKALAKMNDPHLMISCVNRKEFVLINLFEKRDALFLDNDKLITYINDTQVDYVIDNYKKDYGDRAFLFLIDDIRGGRFLKKGKMILKFADGSMTTYGYSSINEIIDKRNILLKTCGDIYTKKIDNSLLIKIPLFSSDTMLLSMDQIKESEEFIKSQNIIFDLRDNPGGRIDLAKRMVEKCIYGIYEYPFLFVDNQKKKNKLVIRGVEKKAFEGKKIILFVNNKTSSCAEFIFAKSLMDFYKDRVVIAGETTAGVGNIASQELVGKSYMLTYTKYRMVNKENENEMFDCKISPNLCYNSSDFNKIVQIYKET